MTRKMLYRLICDRCGHIDEAGDGDVAVNMVRAGMDNNNHYDIIFMDYQMPNKNGAIASKEIRELGYKGLIIGITGNVLQVDTDHFVNCGADKVLHKPVDVKKIDNVVKGLTFYKIFSHLFYIIVLFSLVLLQKRILY
jgi:DNA-binding response OmpR family regulator